MHTNKLTSAVPSGDSPTPPTRDKQAVACEHSVTSRDGSLAKDIDKLADDIDKTHALSLESSPRSSRHSSPGRSAVQIAMAVKTRHPATATASKPGRAPTGLGAHTYDESQNLLHTDKGAYILGPQIGKGSFGEIVQAVGPMGHPVVLKIIDMTQDLQAAADATARADVVKKHRREFMAMRKADSRYQPLDMAEVDNKLFIALPPLRVHVGDEGLRIMMNDSSRPHVANCMFHDISADLARAHAQHWLHRDIKHENFMTDPHGRVVLIDFGEAMELPRGGALTTCDEFCNVELFAPETYLHWYASFDGDKATHGERKDTPASEMFSLGLCWAMLAIKRDTHPFEHRPEAHRAWQNRVHAMLPVDSATGHIDLAALEAKVADLPPHSHDAHLGQLVVAMCRADLRMGSFVALKVMHPDPALRPAAGEAREYSSPSTDDLRYGRDLLRDHLPSDLHKQAQIDTLMQRYDGMQSTGGAPTNG